MIKFVKYRTTLIKFRKFYIHLRINIKITERERERFIIKLQINPGVYKLFFFALTTFCKYNLNAFQIEIVRNLRLRLIQDLFEIVHLLSIFDTFRKLSYY